MTRKTKPHRRRATVLFAALFAGALLLAACGDADRPGITIPDGSTPGTDAPEGTAPPETAPPETSPPETAPPETSPPESAPPETSPPAPEEPADDGDGSEKILIALLIGAALVGGVLLISSMMGRNKNPAPAQQATPAPPSPKRQLLGNIQWLHDQLSLELLTGSAEQASQRWATERSRTDNMAIQAQQIAAAGGGAAWQQLASSVSGLSSALDTAINLRADDEADPTIVREAVSVVNRKRSDLLRVINNAAMSA